MVNANMNLLLKSQSLPPLALQNSNPFLAFHYRFDLKCIAFLQGFVSAVSHMRSFVPAIYDVTVAVPKGQPSPTMLRLFKGQRSVVSRTHLLIMDYSHKYGT